MTTKLNPVSIALLLALGCSAAGCLANIRPDSLADLPPSADAESRGRAILDRSAEAYGATAAMKAGRIEFEMTDQWRGMAAMMANPWPSKQANLQMNYRIGSFDARATFLDGKREGQAWGLQSWKTYEIGADGTAEFKKNKDAEFILAALHYQFEFPIRAREAELVAYGGQETINGKTYDLVFVTWSSYAPHIEHDQYVAYINPENGRLEKLAHTIRAFARFATSVVHFSDFQTFDGVTIPMTSTINGAVDDEDGEGYMHRVTIKPETVRLGGDPSVFVVDPTLSTSRAGKPAGA